ncbi:hypothetical protein CR513_19435, partial [Mucuna pruriens]
MELLEFALSRGTTCALSHRFATNGRAHQRYIASERPSAPKTLEVLQAKAEDRGWMTLIWNYLHNGTSSEDKVEVAKIRQTASQYIIKASHSYKREFSTPLVKCLTKTQT